MFVAGTGHGGDDNDDDDEDNEEEEGGEYEKLAIFMNNIFLFQVFCYLSSSANTTESCRFIVPVFN
jgi:hypothetical protein